MKIEERYLIIRQRADNLKIIANNENETMRRRQKSYYLINKIINEIYLLYLKMGKLYNPPKSYKSGGI